MKRLAPLILAAPLLLVGCASSEPGSQDNKNFDEASGPSNEDLEAAGRKACIEALDKANKTSSNMPTIAHDPEAEFNLSRAEGYEMQGTMTWTATIYTKAGIPWEHMAQCIADVSTDPPKITHLTAEVPGLSD